MDDLRKLLLDFSETLETASKQARLLAKNINPSVALTLDSKAVVQAIHTFGRHGYAGGARHGNR